MTSDPLPPPRAIPMPTQEPLPKKRNYISLSYSRREVYKTSSTAPKRHRRSYPLVRTVDPTATIYRFAERK